MIDLFVYGTLTLDDVVECVTGRHFRAEPAVLDGFRMGRLRGQVYPGITRSPRDHVVGRVLYSIPEETVSVLDAYEDACYERSVVRVTAGPKAEERSVETYFIPDAQSSLVSSDPWDRAEFASKHLVEFLRSCRS